MIVTEDNEGIAYTVQKGTGMIYGAHYFVYSLDPTYPQKYVCETTVFPESMIKKEPWKDVNSLLALQRKFHIYGYDFTEEQKEAAGGNIIGGDFFKTKKEAEQAYIDRPDCGYSITKPAAGSIILGYPGIGKSSTCLNGFVDLESSYFTPYNEKNDFNQYFQVAVSIARQGFNVFVSTHSTVVALFKKMVDSEEMLSQYGIYDVRIICPAKTLKDQWIDRLRKRYEYTKKEKDRRALRRASEHFDEDIDSLVNCGLIVHQIEKLPYDIRDLLESIGYEINY